MIYKAQAMRWNGPKPAVARWARGMMGRVLFVFLMMGVMLSGRTYGQSSTGTITGLVVDQKNGVVRNAKVVVTSNNGAVKSTTTTSAGGVYEVPSLPPGVYTVLIEAKGFSSTAIQDVNVTVGGVQTEDATLRIGTANETITVTSADPLLTQGSATLETTVDQSMIVELPFSERSTLGVAMFAPGVTGDPQASDGVGSEVVGAFVGAIAPAAGLGIAGSRDGYISQLVDGSDNQLAGVPRAGVSFSGDAIRSVTVQSVGLPAQYGRSGGGIVNQATAAGGSKYHGALRWRHRDPFFEPNSHNPPPSESPDEHLNLYTAEVNGPVPMPFHKNNTFFLFAWEPLRYTNLTFIRRRLYTPDEIAGRFINSYDELNHGTLSSSGYAAAVAAPRLGGQFYQFHTNAQGFPVGNRLPSSVQYVHILNDDVSAQAVQNPITRFLYDTMPRPGDGNPYAHFYYPDAHYDPDGTNGLGARGVITNDNRYGFRIDENITSRDRVFFRFNSVPISGLRYDFVGKNSPLGNIPSESIKSESMTLSYVRTISSNQVNEFRFTYLRTNDTTAPIPAALTMDWGAALGMPGAVMGKGVPGFSQGNNLQSLGTTEGTGTTLSENYGAGDDFSLVKGRHLIKFGFDYRALQLNRYDTTGQFGGQVQYTNGLTGGAIDGNTLIGSPLAAYMLGIFGGYSISTPKNYYYRWKYGAAYIQDDWRIFPRLTLNLGLRYNVETPRSEKFNYQGTFLPTGTGITANGATAPGGFAFAGTNGIGTTAWPVNYKGLEPRLGFAFQPNKFMTVRAAYTLMHVPLSITGTNIDPNLTSGTTAIANNGSGGVISNTDPVNPSYVNLITNPIAPFGIPPAPPRNSTLLETWGLTSYLPLITQTSAVPYMQLWSLSLQFQLSRGTLIETSYVGSKGTHLFSTPVPTNDPAFTGANTYGQTTCPVISGAAVCGLIPLVHANYAFGTASVDKFGVLTSNLQKLRPFPQFSQNPIYTAFDRNADSNYNALYLSGHQQAGFGVTILANFSWSKSLDDASSGLGGPGDTVFDSYGVNVPQGYTVKGDYSNSIFDIPVHAGIGYTWQLPFGRGQKHLASISRWADLAIGGWSTGGTAFAQSGVPYFVWASYEGQATSTATYFCSSVSTPCDQTALTDVTLRPNVIHGVPLIKKNWKIDPMGKLGSSGGYINPAAFSMPGSLGNPALGNAPRTMANARAPRTIYWNGSFRKKFELPRHAHLEMWTDVTNLMNHLNYFTQGSTITQRGVFDQYDSKHDLFIPNPNFGDLVNNSGPRQWNVGVAVTF